MLPPPSRLGLANWRPCGRGKIRSAKIQLRGSGTLCVCGVWYHQPSASTPNTSAVPSFTASNSGVLAPGSSPASTACVYSWDSHSTSAAGTEQSGLAAGHCGPFSWRSPTWIVAGGMKAAFQMYWVELTWTASESLVPSIRRPNTVR